MEIGKVAYFSNKPGVKIGSIGFFYSWNNKQGTDDETTLKIDKAQLIKKSDAGVDDLKATEIIDDGCIYNLHGQRVINPSKGIYIKNGKKIIIH